MKAQGLEAAKVFHPRVPPDCLKPRLRKLQVVGDKRVHEEKRAGFPRILSHGCALAGDRFAQMCSQMQ
eukprot:7150387-Alexandrium_andersonii.AAC.1